MIPEHFFYILTNKLSQDARSKPFIVSFYRAMHYSAKLGIEIACRLSVCLSVTLVDQDHIGWKS